MAAPTTTKRKRGRISNLAAAAQRKIEESIKGENNSLLEEPTGGLNETFDINDHPLKVGSWLTVRYRDGSDRLVKIIERSQDEINSDVWQYYIHYHDFNRRMDEWIFSDRILSSATAPIIKHHDSHGKAAGNSATHATLSHSESMDVVSVVDSEKSVEIKANETIDNELATGTSLTRISTIAEMDHDEHEGLDEASLLEHEEITKIKNIQRVQLGRYIMECWYFSPFPKEFYPNGHIPCLYFCEFSFRFFCTKEELVRYQLKPQLARHPPGNEIYRDNNVSMFELDGAVEKVYCQNLCYFAKLFLDHKTLYWDVDPFLFYVLCARDERGFHPVGYFSKEKYSDLGYNLACILTFPCMQRKGYGRFLIAFSYELSKKEEKAGSPEKPLSDLGAVGYKSYWASVLLRVLKTHSTGPAPLAPLSIMDLSRITSILSDDIVATLQLLGLLRTVSKAGATAEEDVSYALCVPPDLLDALLLKYPENTLGVDAERLHWAPLYVTDPKKDKWSFKSKKDFASQQQHQQQATTTSVSARSTSVAPSAADDNESISNMSTA